MAKAMPRAVSSSWKGNSPCRMIRESTSARPSSLKSSARRESSCEVGGWERGTIFVAASLTVEDAHQLSVSHQFRLLVEKKLDLLSAFPILSAKIASLLEQDRAATASSTHMSRSQEEFARWLKEHVLAGKAVEPIAAENYNHFELLETLASPYGILGNAALRMMKLGSV